MSKDMEVKNHEVLLENPQYVVSAAKKMKMKSKITGDTVQEKIEVVGQILRAFK